MITPTVYILLFTEASLIFSGLVWLFLVKPQEMKDAYTRGYNDGRAAAVAEMREAVK